MVNMHACVMHAGVCCVPWTLWWCVWHGVESDVSIAPHSPVCCLGAGTLLCHLSTRTHTLHSCII